MANRRRSLHRNTTQDNGRNETPVTDGGSEQPVTPNRASSDLESEPTSRTRIGDLSTIVGLILGLFLLPAIAATGLVEQGIVGIAIKWVVALSLIALVVWVEGMPLASIGLERPRLVDIRWAGVVFVTVIGMFIASGPLLDALGIPTELSAPSMASLAIGLASAITAGITEEILYRGYPIERLIDADFDPHLAGGLTWLLFTIAHFGAGIPLGTYIQVGLAGLIITAAYVRVRSLAPVMLGHAAVDTVGVLVLFFG